MYINEHELWLLAAFYLFMLVLVIRIVYEYELIHKKTLSKNISTLSRHRV